MNYAILAPDSRLVFGLNLSIADQRYAVANFEFRYTGQHKPEWAKLTRADGTAYPMPFANDAEWLANTKFVVKASGALDRQYDDCVSTPTWPNNPELRRLSLETVLA